MRAKKYLDIDVLTAARQRMRHVFDIFDTVAVMWSGGKDSTVALHLAREVAEERGLGPIDVVFRDEELIPDAVVDFVASYRGLDWLRLHWFAVPLASHKFILGRTFPYTQWDPDRPHVRNPPDDAIRLPQGDPRVFDQYNCDAFVASRFRGSVAFVTGIRADESLMRLRSCINKLNENYITATAAPNVRLCKPIYDWSEDDVFKFLGDSGIPHCPWYDAQLFAGCQLRVSTPLHAEQAKRLGKLRELDPAFYDRILAVFPEVAAQDRYWAELDREGMRAEYGQSIEGLRRYVDEHYDDPDQHSLATKRLAEVESLHARNPKAYPLLHLLRYFVGGTIKRLPLPQKTK